MAFITPKELETHLYKENIEAISREDETILTAAIDAAVQEAYGYLGAYDRKKIFEATGSQRNALLLIFVKDIAVWHFVNLCDEQELLLQPFHVRIILFVNVEDELSSPVDRLKVSLDTVKLFRFLPGIRYDPDKSELFSFLAK